MLSRRYLPRSALLRSGWEPGTCLARRTCWEAPRLESTTGLLGAEAAVNEKLAWALVK